MMSMRGRCKLTGHRMKSLFAFLRLIRWPNLVFILLTQSLFYYVVFACGVADRHQFHPQRLFLLLMTASALIAAAGYIINDYFDLHIDAVNKPGKVLVRKLIRRRWAIVWHLVLSGAGIVISLYISYRLRSSIIVIVNTCCVLLLWFYSTTLKKKLLSGNILIAALTAWVIVVVYFFCGGNDIEWHGPASPFNARRLFKFTVLYAGFAFIISLVREVIKDLEDMEGDAKYNCRTLPISWGVPAAKIFTGVWMVVCMASLVIVQLYAWRSGWWVVAPYTVFLIIIPLAVVLKKLARAVTAADYHLLSSYLKFIMLAGILSMLFFIY